MFEPIMEMIKYRDLLYMLTLRDIKIKYKQSIMGFLWAILMPSLVITAGILVRLGMAHLSGRTFSMSEVATVSVKALPWSLFVGGLRFATNSLTSNANLVTKVYLPRNIFPISAILSQLVDSLVGATVLAFVLAFLGVGSSMLLLWTPILITLIVLMVMALGMVTSALNLFYRDIKYIVETVLTFAIFFTPVFYEAKIAGSWAWLLLLNPIAPLLEALNDTIVLHRSPQLPWIAYSAAVALLGFPACCALFKRLEPKFAEII
jgi:lipopolysaccharide transport system permease protein